MNEHKYVILDCSGLPSVCIFPLHLDHGHMFLSARRISQESGIECADRPLGAGQCRLFDGRWQTFGLSWSLNLDASKEDEDIINTAFGLRKV
jgi:hypothetical protein